MSTMVAHVTSVVPPPLSLLTLTLTLTPTYPHTHPHTHTHHAHMHTYTHTRPQVLKMSQYLLLQTASPDALVRLEYTQLAVPPLL